MQRERSSVVVLAGPNGAGKSTMAAELLVEVLGVSEFVDADVFARTLPRSGAAAITAGRAMLRRLDELGTSGQDFGFETTLASRSPGIPLAAERRSCGGEGGGSRTSWGARRAGADDSSPLPLGLTQLLRSLSAFDDDVADVRQFDTRAT